VERISLGFTWREIWEKPLNEVARAMRMTIRMTLDFIF
jgi:ubiquinone biosynthesis protein Coq4